MNRLVRKLRDLNRVDTYPHHSVIIPLIEYGIRYTEYKCQELFSPYIYFKFKDIREIEMAAGFGIRRR